MRYRWDGLLVYKKFWTPYPEYLIPPKVYENTATPDARPEQPIIVDNNSTDSTKQVVQNLSQINTKIKYFFENKKGLSNARNHGVQQSTGDVIVFTDDDVIINRPLSAKLAIYSNGQFTYEDVPLSTNKKKELRQYYLAELQKHQEVQEISSLRSELETLKKRLAEKDELLKLIKINLSKE
jgi:glycosyltransferase involved in cell wall biosynthesis